MKKGKEHLQVIKKADKKHKWSLSNLMTAVHILLNSYINLYDFQNLPEGQPQKERPSFESYKINAYLQPIKQQY